MSTVYLSAAHAPDRRRGGTDRPGAAVPLCIAGLCVLALALTWVVAALVPATHVKDAVALHDFTLLGGPRLDDVANALLHLLDPLLYTIWGVLLIAVALMRRRPRVALAVALVLSLAPLTAEILKPLLAHPHAWVGAKLCRRRVVAEWSRDCGDGPHPVRGAGGATASTPARRRAGRYVRGGNRVLAADSRLALPSDVLGGYLVGTLWVALAVAGLRAAEARSRSRRSRSSVRAVGAGVP